MTFSSYSELVQYLSTINPTYVKYADGLWAKEVTSPSQLGNAPMTSILACGVQSPIHAEDIITLSKFTGKCFRDSMLVPCKMQGLHMPSLLLPALTCFQDSALSLLVSP